MDNFWKSFKFNTFILSCTLSIFTLNVISPIYGVQQQNEVNLNDINFALRIKKLIDKVNSYREKKNGKKLIEVMFDIKKEVENYTNQKFNIENAIDEIEQAVKNRNGKVDKQVIKQIKRNFKNHQKKFDHKATYMANCVKFNLPYSDEEEDLLFQDELTHNKHNHEKDKEKDKEICIPLRVTIGITLTLCGFFLWCVPIPICKQYAPYIMETGIAFLVDEGITQYEEKDKEDK